MTDWERIIDNLQLESHPEGGWYRQTWISDDLLPAEAIPGHGGDRPAGTSIYFLITSGNFSAMHRLASDEVWYHHCGDALEVVMIHPGGELEIRTVGSCLDGLDSQLSVPAGCWFGSRVREGGRWSLAGCAVAPGFDYADFELAERQRLVTEYPQHRDIIDELTR